VSRERALLDGATVAAFRLLYAAVAAFFLLPVVVVIATSFSTSSPPSFPPSSVSLVWYSEFVSDTDWLSSVENTLLVAVTTGVFAAGLGSSAAYGARSAGGFVKTSAFILAVVPLTTPLIVVAVSLVVLFGRFGAVGSYTAVVVGHTVITAPLGFLITYSALARVDWSVRESAADLGGSSFPCVP